MSPRKGWFKRQSAAVHEETRHWPQSMKRNAGLTFNPDVDPLLTDYEAELQEKLSRAESLLCEARLWLKDSEKTAEVAQRIGAYIKQLEAEPKAGR